LDRSVEKGLYHGANLAESERQVEAVEADPSTPLLYVLRDQSGVCMDRGSGCGLGQVRRMYRSRWTATGVRSCMLPASGLRQNKNFVPRWKDGAASLILT